MNTKHNKTQSTLKKDWELQKYNGNVNKCTDDKYWV